MLAIELCVGGGQAASAKERRGGEAGALSSTVLDICSALHAMIKREEDIDWTRHGQ